MARNFIKTYGRQRFRRLLVALEASESCQIIGDDFGVSRERVRQWRTAFGVTLVHYQLYADVAKVLMERATS
jgi:4-alpha-glucanotransferase